MTASRIGPSVFFVCDFVLLRKIFEVPKPRMKRPGPAASWTTRASIAACTGWRVDAAMIPQPIVRRSVARPISAATPVEERASIPCLRHHGYASASQIVSMPALSMARADSSMTSSGSMVSCITPMRNGCAIGGLLVRLGLERARALLGAARPRRRLRVGRRGSRRAVVLRSLGMRCDRALHLALERREDVRDLLVHDRLQHPLAHRADRPRELDVGGPFHGCATVDLCEVERRLHRQHRSDAMPLDVERRVLGRTLLDLV